MDRCNLSWSKNRAMRDELDTLRIAKRRDLQKLRYTTGLRNIRLRDIDGAGCDHCNKVVHASRVFACSYSVASRSANTREPDVIFRRPDRLLKPTEIQRFQYSIVP